MVNGQTSWHRVRNGTTSTVLPWNAARSVVTPAWVVRGMVAMDDGTAREPAVPVDAAG